MRKLLKGRLTYANVVATLALCIAVGGASAFAATQLPKNSVTAKAIKAKAVTTAKIKNDAVTGAKVKAGSLDASDLAAGTIPVVPPQQVIPPQVDAYTKTESNARYLGAKTVVVVKTIGTSIAAGTFAATSVNCPTGYQAISGGVDIDGLLDGKVSASAPMINGTRTEATADGQQGPATGWYGGLSTQGAAGTVAKAKLAVICSQIG